MAYISWSLAAVQGRREDGEYLEMIETELLNTALEQNKHNKSRSARDLASAVRTFSKKSSGWGTDIGSDLSHLVHK
jgi:hypothetical protein